MTTDAILVAGELVAHGSDHRDRADAIRFRGPVDPRGVAYLERAILRVEAWAQGRAQLLERPATTWQPVTRPMPSAVLYLVPGRERQIVFSEFVRLEPGREYLLHLEHGRVSPAQRYSPTGLAFWIVADFRPDSLWQRARRAGISWRRVKRA